MAKKWVPIKSGKLMILKKFKYYAVSENCGEFYSTKDEALKDCKKDIWDGKLVILYSLKNTQNISELGYDDEIGRSQSGVKIK